ncbi:MAG: sugar-binding protein [Bryobacteraceae bacterium]
MRIPGSLIAASVAFWAVEQGVAQEVPKPDPYGYVISVPRLERPAVIDGDLSEWKRLAFTDGVWDMERIRRSPWYDAAINRLTDHGGEPDPEHDLAARYYVAWDDRYLYLGAEVTDNVNDTTDPAHEAKRWYYKDAICWFVEAPRGAGAKKFGESDNAFCFVIDPAKPSYGAWWRHGAAGRTYIEQTLPSGAVQYALRMGPRGRKTGDFVLEARVEMAPTLGQSSRAWQSPRVGDVYGLEIVHTDPDGGGYGGHFLIYGRGDDDSTWGWMELAGPAAPIERKPN